MLVARPEVGLVYGDMTVIDEDGEVLQESWLAGDVTPEGRCLGAQLAGNNVTASSIVMRGAALRAVAPIPAGVPWADWWLAGTRSRTRPPDGVAQTPATGALPQATAAR